MIDGTKKTNLHGVFEVFYHVGCLKCLSSNNGVYNQTHDLRRFRIFFTDYFHVKNKTKLEMDLTFD